VANAVAEAYVQFTIETQFTTSDQATEFLADQIGKLRTDLADLDRRLQQYGESKGIVSIDDASNITLRALLTLHWRRAPTARAKAVHDTLRTPRRGPRGRSRISSPASRAAGGDRGQYGGRAALRAISRGCRRQGRLSGRTASSRSRRHARVPPRPSDYRKALEGGNLTPSGTAGAIDLKRDSVEFANLRARPPRSARCWEPDRAAERRASSPQDFRRPAARAWWTRPSPTALPPARA
jgi:hypothetical protein